jgi:hypothetical protein
MTKVAKKKSTIQLNQQDALDELFSSGKVSYTFKIAGRSMTISTIDIKEQLALEKSMQEIRSMPSSFVLFKYTLDTLVYTCTQFDTVNLADKSIAERLEFLEKQTPLILQKLVEKYEALSALVKEFLADPDEVIENFSQGAGPQE